MFGFKDSPAEFFIGFAVSCIEPVIPGHLEIFFRYMLNKQGNKVHNRKRFFHIRIIFMFIVMEGYILPIIGINAGRGNDRASEITTDVFYNGVSVAEIRFGIDIEPIFIFSVNGRLSFFERRADTFFQFVEEGGLESLVEVSVVEMFYDPPEAVIREAAFRKETVNMWIPFQGSAEGMQDTDEPRDKVFGFIQ